VDVEPPSKPKFRWRMLAAVTLVSLLIFVVMPRLFLRNEFEPIGPTDKLRFLRAFQRSEYRRVGQREVRVVNQTLVVVWDLRWNALPESKQQEIVRNAGRAWHTVGGEDTQVRIEGQDETVASYVNGEVHFRR